MFLKKCIFLILLLLMTLFSIGCSKNKENNNEILDIIFCPGVAYSSGAAGSKFVFASINRNNASGYLKDINGKSLDGGTLRPGNSSSFNTTETRCFLEKSAALPGKYKLAYEIANETQMPIEKQLDWLALSPDFSSVPNYSIINSETAFKSIQVNFGPLRNLPEGASVLYRIKLYQFQEGGQMLEMSSQQTSANSLTTTFRQKEKCFPVLEGLIVKDGSVIMAIHYILSSI